jgi:hypothetical protein
MLARVLGPAVLAQSRDRVVERERSSMPGLRCKHKVGWLSY